MAADHRRKRLNGVSIAGCSSGDQRRTKKKKLESQKNGLNAKSLISLEWDGNQRKVVAKREQVGISRRHLRPFIDSAPQYHSNLADVFTVPQEVFELENLAEVLPCEVWQTQLSEKERNFLMQFLPEGQNTEEVVQKLLSGENFHFGNPLLKWSTFLCTGKFHPDSVLHHERCLKSQKKEYYSGLQNYHDGMIQYLQKLKDTWENTKNSEKEVLQKTWRSRKDAERRISLHSNVPGFGEPGESFAATSESCSFVAEEKACSSDNQNSPVIKGGQLQNRTGEKVSTKEKSRKPLVSSDDARHGSGDKLKKRNIHHCDGAKYMSYLKISKKQHELIKNMKQAGKSIHSKTLNSVLGNINTLNVQPYEEFVKEEQKKVQEHWLHLANKDLPLAHANWTERKFQIQDIAKSLYQEMMGRTESLEGLAQENDKTLLLDQNDQGKRNRESNVEDDEQSGSDSLRSLSSHQISSPSDGYYLNPVEINQSAQNHTPQCISVLGGGHHPIDINAGDNQSPEQISSLSGGYDLNPMDMNSENDHMESKSDGTSRFSVNSGNENAVDDTNSQGVPISSGGDVWSTVSVPNTYFDSTANLEFPSTSGLPLPHQVNDEQQSQLIDMGADVHEGGTPKYLLHGQSDDGSFSSYQNHSFSNHDRSGLLQSLFKGPETLSYNHEQKQTGLDFQSPNSMMMENGQFSQHLHGQFHTSLPLEARQKRLNEDFMHQNLIEDVYPEGGGYVTPRQGHVPPVNMQDWNVNPARMSERVQSHLHDGLLTHNWYPGEHQNRDGWTSLGAANIPSQSIGSNADQSLLSVLSQCNQLRSSSSLDSMRSAEEFMLPRSYGMGGGVTPRMSNSLPPVSHPFDYLSGRDTTNSLLPDDMGWMNLPQNSALHDPMGKPYLRSWNQ